MGGSDGTASGSVGRGSSIAPGARVVDSALWDRVTVETGAIVERSVLADDVRVPSGMVLRDCAVVPGDGRVPREHERIEQGLLVAPLG